ncbi:hypothetical protein BC835DRAFT_1464922 [Cytidiella melzeri]|nr:hypothetical protein BC835DRAFT_1464922 [Cytidiella melzeri]
MKRGSKVSHIKTATHRRAKEAETQAAQQQSTGDDSAGRGSSANSGPVALQLFGQFDTDIEMGLPESPLNPPFDNPFHNMTVEESHFLDENGEDIVFSAGPSLRNNEVDGRKALEQELGFLGLVEDQGVFGCAASSVTDLGIDDEWINDEDGEDPIIEELRMPQNDDWAPHNSKTLFMLDMLDNLPHLQLSDDHLKAIIWVMRECGTLIVPTFALLRKKQAAMNQNLEFQPEHHTSLLGNHFFYNHPAKLIALDFANRLVRPLLHIYPEVAGPVSEFWQGKKWVEELSYDKLSPMWADWENAPHQHYFIKELARVNDQNFVMPVKWITVNGEVHAEAYPAKLFSVADPSVVRVRASKLRENILDLKNEFQKSSLFPWTSETVNCLRIKADGQPMFRLRAMPWSNNVSGNVSKQYNAHTNVYIQNTCIPHKKLAQEFYVRFVSTSTFASSSEQLAGVSSDFTDDAWHDAYDCQLGHDVIFQITKHLLPADNPQQSEDCSHIGVKGNRNCRRDTVGGADAEKETDKGYEALYHPGTPCNADNTACVLCEQLRVACRGNKDAVQSIQTQTGVKDKLAQFWVEHLLASAREQQDHLLKDPPTRDSRLNDKGLKGDARKAVRPEVIDTIQDSLWNWFVDLPPEADGGQRPRDLIPGFHYKILLSCRGIDPHRDMAIEILHSFLLGNDKYVWHETSSPWDKKKEELFAVRLQATDIDGLSIALPRAKYLVRYKNSLIGKHFKCLQQLAVFHLSDLCTDTIFNVWKATGELGAHLWIPEIADMEQYLTDLDILIGNLLDAWATFDPRRIIAKAKLHILTHLVDDIRRFGSAILYSTEVFECWNAVFRMCSILSNHLAPSQDIATTLGGMERFKHQVSGGWWKDGKGGYIRAGKNVREFLRCSPELQRQLGWADTSNVEAGPWIQGKAVISQSHDICKENSWVFFNFDENAHAGRILRIAQHADANGSPDKVMVLVEHFDHFNMPISSRSQKVYAVNPKSIQFIFNAQHDCRTGRCELADSDKVVIQERLRTKVSVKSVVHRDDGRYILNMHALHNAHLVCSILPRSLTTPVPLVPDRKAFHRQIAEGLRVSGPAKRAETQAKAKNTREKKKQAAMMLPAAPGLKPVECIQHV